MIAPLSPNTQAILLLTAPLVAGRSEPSRDLLSLGDYNRLARILRENKKQPADLLRPDAIGVIGLCAQAFGRARLESLLGRGFLLSQAVERWNTRAIWVLSRADASYPKRLRTRLKEDAPPVLYGCGDVTLLDKGGLAVVGSRNVDDDLIRYTEAVGRMAAEAHRSIVSGAARGIDQAAMHGALAAGGTVAGVMADSLERAALAHDNREALMGGRLVLISPYDPTAGFNVGHAMQRNKLIYALADAALVVNSDFEKGGTWTGAVEQLDRLRFVPVFVRNGASMPKGNAALLQRGAKAWPNPQSSAEFGAAMVLASESAMISPAQESLPLLVREDQAAYDPPPVATPEPSPASETATSSDSRPPSGASEELLAAVKAILRCELVTGKTAEEVAALLAITPGQAKAWIAQLVTDGFLEKINHTKPARYHLATASGRLL
jgi:predicted Rossmann fold nucleotide-binding protein DprA/Smf involved in DNA uptake